MSTINYESKKAKLLNIVESENCRRAQNEIDFRSKNRVGPVSSTPTKIRQLPPTDFRMFYDRGDLPVAIEHTSAGNKIIWKAEIDSLDYHHYLPIFVEGLRETQHPYAFLAREGVNNLLEHGKNRVLPVIPQLILPLHQGLETRDPEIICVILNVI